MSSVSINTPSAGEVFTQQNGNIKVTGQADRNGVQPSGVWVRIYASAQAIPNPFGADPVPAGAVAATLNGSLWHHDAVPLAICSTNGSINYIAAWAKFNDVWSGDTSITQVECKYPTSSSSSSSSSSSQTPSSSSQPPSSSSSSQMPSSSSSSQPPSSSSSSSSSSG